MFYLFAILMAVASALACCLLEARKWSINKMIKNMHGPEQYPIIGVGHRFIGKDNEGVMEAVAELFSDPVTPAAAWFGPKLVVGIARPEDMQTVLMSNNCLQKGYMYGFMHNKTGIFTSDAETWKQHRRILNPTFSLKVLTSYVSVFNEKAKIMCDNMALELGQGIDMYRFMFLCTMDITVNTVMSSKMELQNRDGEILLDAFTKAFESIARRMFRFWEISDFIYKRTQAYADQMQHFQVGYDFVRRLVDDKTRELAEKLAHGEDVLENERRTNSLTYMHKCMLMWRQGTFDEKNVLEEIETILIGGIDTSSVTVTHTIMMLAIHQDVQERVLTEIRDVLGDCSESDELVTQEHVGNLTYLQQVIQESLRLLPAGPYLARTCTEPLALKDSIIPKGALVMLLFDKMNHDPSIWGADVNDFNPDRFLPERVAERHPWSFLPYSGGPRNCIGIKHAAISVRIMLVHLLRRYKFTTRLRLNEIRVKMDVTLKIVNENPVLFEPRNKIIP